jgi:hypothetical protein
MPVILASGLGSKYDVVRSVAGADTLWTGKQVGRDTLGTSKANTQPIAYTRQTWEVGK